MFGIDSSEFLLIAIVALVVIGPKELPGLLRSWGKWMAKMRGMAAEFRGHVDEMVRQSDLDEVKKQLEGSSGLDLQALDPTREIKSHFQEGIAEGEKAIADAKANLDTVLAEPDSAPQIGLEETPAAVDASPAESAVPEPLEPAIAAPVAAGATAGIAPPTPSSERDSAPAKAAAAG